MRGEYQARGGAGFDSGELPPRARRILLAHNQRTLQLGTTSACAENTASRRVPKVFAGNYLRVRGEYAGGIKEDFFLLELPPRARRIPYRPLGALGPIGTTSACAENTKLGGLDTKTHGNYLRVRGEYLRLMEYRKALSELPPRARRIHSYAYHRHPNPGTTSACAENTPILRFIPRKLWNYLRVRGEYSIAFPIRSITPELPPRARRIPSLIIEAISSLRTTSACAENTWAHPPSYR